MPRAPTWRARLALNATRSRRGEPIA